MAPFISGLNPSNGDSGKNNLWVDISGANFAQGAGVTSGGYPVSIDAVQWQSASLIKIPDRHRIQFELGVDVSITVTNPGGGSDVSSRSMSMEFSDKMRLKYIIAAVLGLAGILFGAWNWMQYFPARRVRLRRESRVSGRPRAWSSSSRKKYILRGRRLCSVQAQIGDSAVPRLKVPLSARRNPFLTPQEEASLAQGIMPDITDATQAPMTDMSGLPPIQVKGLVKDNASGRYRAIINGKYYTAGDMLGEEKIIEISASALVLESGERRRTISIGRAGEASAGIRMRRAP